MTPLPDIGPAVQLRRVKAVHPVAVAAGVGVIAPSFPSIMAFPSAECALSSGRELMGEGGGEVGLR